MPAQPNQSGIAAPQPHGPEERGNVTGGASPFAALATGVRFLVPWIAENSLRQIAPAGGVRVSQELFQLLIGLEDPSQARSSADLTGWAFFAPKSSSRVACRWARGVT